jgi:exosortase
MGDVSEADVLIDDGRTQVRTEFGKTIIVGVVLTVLLGALYGDILIRMGTQWYDDPDYSHGFLIPFLSGYFVWERREKLRALSPRPNVWGIGLLGLGLLMLVIGSLGAELYLQRSSLIVVLAGLVLLLRGRESLRVLAFPIVVLFFMIPLPAIVVNAVAFPLQLFAAQTATYCLYNFGIPVLREGNVILLAGTTLEVAEACSGIRSLQALLALGTVFGYFSQRAMWKRWALVFLSIPIAIAANAFRVTGTGVLANYWGVEAAVGFYHTFQGWLIFVVAFLLLLGAGAILSRIGTRREARGNRAEGVSGRSNV